MDVLNREKDKHLGLRIDSELHYKLHYISKYEGRSANGEVIYLIRKAIEEFEKEHGKIE
jgi:predicted DNA-binding protein